SVPASSRILGPERPFERNKLVGSEAPGQPRCLNRWDRVVLHTNPFPQDFRYSQASNVLIALVVSQTCAHRSNENFNSRQRGNSAFVEIERIHWKETWRRVHHQFIVSAPYQSVQFALLGNTAFATSFRKRLSETCQTFISRWCAV